MSIFIQMIEHLTSIYFFNSIFLFFSIFFRQSKIFIEYPDVIYLVRLGIIENQYSISNLYYKLYIFNLSFDIGKKRKYSCEC